MDEEKPIKKTIDEWSFDFREERAKRIKLEKWFADLQPKDNPESSPGVTE